MDEGHERQNLCRGRSSARPLRRSELAQHQDVGVGEQHVENAQTAKSGLDSLIQALDVVAPWPGWHFPGDAAAEQDSVGPAVVVQVAKANAAIAVVASAAIPSASAAAIVAISISGRSTNGGSSAMLMALWGRRPAVEHAAHRV